VPPKQDYTGQRYGQITLESPIKAPDPPALADAAARSQGDAGVDAWFADLQIEKE
jgi:hypothetical protein